MPPIDQFSASQKRTLKTAFEELEATSVERWLAEVVAADLAHVHDHPVGHRFRGEPWSEVVPLRVLQMMSAQPLATMKFLGMHDRLVHGDLERMGGAIQQYRRLMGIVWIYGGGDHASQSRTVLESLSVGDFENARRVWPAEVGQSSNRHPYTRTVANLLLALLHPHAFDADQVRTEGAAFLARKNAGFDAALIGALVAILDADPEALSERLHDIAKAYSQAGLHRLYNGIGRLSATYAYGLLLLAASLHGDGFVDEIRQPDAAVWDRDFVVRVRERRPFAPYVVFGGDLEPLNDPYQWPPGRCS